MKQRILKQLSIFMILLIVTIPIAIAESTVSINSYHGQDNVEGFMRSFDDYLEVTAITTPELEENTTFTNFTTSNVLIDIFGTQNVFNTCEEVSGTYTCTYTTTQTDREGAEENFVISLHNDEGTQLVSEEAFFYIDEQPPEITTFEYPTYFTGDTNITIAATDTACPTCTDVCAGIETMDLTFTDVITTSIEGEGLCEYSDIIEISTDTLEQGTQTFCVVATDRTQNSEEQCATITVDTLAPSISSSSFVIQDNDGNSIEHMSTGAIATTVSVEITEEVSGLDTSTVYADLSSLNYVSPETYQNMLGSCTETDSTYTCTWSVYIELLDADGNPQYETVTAEITATDSAGNVGTLSKTISLVDDTTAPIVMDITSAFDKYINAGNNTITMEIQEQGSGFDNLAVYLDVTDLGLTQVQADRCENSGTWYCYWETLIIPSSLRDGKEVDLGPASVIDDAGNSYDVASSIESVDFIYDEDGPEFVNITIEALGREADVITAGDVVAITAYLTDDVSGVDENKVYADFSAFDSSNDLSASSYCAEIEPDLWECYWEYIGSLDAGESISLDVIAYDVAGNVKNSDDDNVHGTIRVVGTLDAAGNFWSDVVDVDAVPTLNPNFLYFTSSGTMVRFDTELMSTGATPYVHAFQYDACQAATKLAGDVSALEWYDAAIVGQYYYDETDRTAKYILVQIPAFFYGQTNATVDEGSYIEVQCIGSITQASSLYSDIYGEDESVNLTASIPLYAGLYAEPSLTTVHKIQRLEKLINTLDDINKFLGFWSEWGQKICGPLNGIRVVANNMVTMLKSINSLAPSSVTPAVAGMVEVTNFLNQLWYGARNSDKYKVKKSAIGTTGTSEITYTKDVGLMKSKYRFPSLGYVCDTVLCESCTEAWGSITDGKKDATATGTEVGGEYLPYVGEEKVDWSALYKPKHVSPRENMLVALACNPPCVPGIYAQLNVYKQILVAYNVCLNIATMKGEDIVQCDQFLAAQICQNVVNAFFWHWFWDGLKATMSKAAVNLAFNALSKEVFACTGTLQDSVANPGSACSVYRGGVAFVTLVTTGVDTYNTVKNLFHFKNGLFGNKTAEKNVEELEEQTEEDIGDQIGTTPSY